ncbi:MAG: hypothetical protein HY757_00780 [Nitrospirae bacterium]|nr:hypothetical protein [Nitrospirota bacterium]
MIVGTRILYPEEVNYWNAEILQISVFRGMNGSLDFMRKCTDACKEAGIRYVVHPVKYSLLQEETFNDLREMAGLADLALILHDERTPEGSRLEGMEKAHFRNALEELKSIAHVSIENAAHTGDVRWFWNSFAGSITLDIGHIEAFGLDSVEFVKSLDRDLAGKIEFVHMHRNNGLHGGITDHWPLTPDCRELRALKELLKIRPDVSVILELNEVEEIEDSLDLLRKLRDQSIKADSY